MSNVHSQVREWWWVFAFVFLSVILYERGMEERESLYRDLYAHLNQLRIEKNAALKLQTDFRQQLNSQSDPEWIERILIRELGLVPDGYQKIYFTR